MNKKEAIQEMIDGQRKFMQDVNQNGYEDKRYWLEQEDYRNKQAELAKVIQNEAHRENWEGYKDALKVDIGNIE